MVCNEGMNLDDTAAAYGLFQVVFADIADHIAVAAFRLRELKEPELHSKQFLGRNFRKPLSSSARN
jgi:hypothetical protein